MLKEFEILLKFIIALIHLLPMLESKHVSSLVPISRCNKNDSIDMKEFYLCKLDDCEKWIKFRKCPDKNSSELNFAKESFFCNSTAGPKDTFAIGLMEKNNCEAYISQDGGRISRCEYLHCWFTFEECGNDMELLNFNTLLCQSIPKLTESLQSLTLPIDPSSVHSSINAGEVSGPGKYTLIIALLIGLYVVDNF
ncbi:hypothetical protein Bpfe_030026 [Biomphalaria pfeifferi]|uniref:Folate receptor-like domain-containing protein n=1 Tax=Biomphalaria pfeifferi TaxID=112525 RepID=A0AAD8EVB2_BIOPF|nr:hypothetical protein Bpfe_030026 [Biomphalaria pfeifferi]